MKLAPWELTHLAAFGLAATPDSFTVVQGIGLTVANGLALTYLGLAAATGGRRSVHDFAAGTLVQATEAPAPRP